MRPNHFGYFTSFAVAPAFLAVAFWIAPQLSAQAPAAPAVGSASAVAKPLAGPSASAPPVAAALVKPMGVQTATPATAPTQAPAALTPKKPGGKPGQEGISVHGHWIIDLRNADGSIAEHRDFENSLLSPDVLLRMIAGNVSVGDLGITIASTGSYICTTAFSGQPGPLGSCLVAASSTGGLGGFTCAGASTGFCNFTLKEMTYGGSGGSGEITLAGTMPVLASGAVTEVGTQIFTCSSGGTGFTNVDPITCYSQSSPTNYGYSNFTGTAITALNATAGQTLAFTVVLTFS